ncbi:hypothetical protein CWM47_01295 [Spirosoma pollinicola]|uniref:Uncharacterized protein n=1 Tax=Spirosoma pollinicola TaxID=2057025 RepID=A0A2K8YSG7_9BACT|nr:hypothetical protein CWM47_01295 [Spirosoma pollinicola]
MYNLLHCPKCGSDQLAGFGNKQPISLTDISFNKEEENQVLADLFSGDNRDRQCLHCGFSWNAEQQLLQYQDDQNQINALTFKERAKRFYADYESGQVDHARQIIPIEAIGVYKRKGIKAAYRFLKLIEVKTGRFKRRAMFAAAAVILIPVAIYLLSCN